MKKDDYKISIIELGNFQFLAVAEYPNERPDCALFACIANAASEAAFQCALQVEKFRLTLKSTVQEGAK